VTGDPLPLPLRTERLWLRRVTGDDAAALHAYRSLPEVARYVPFAPMSLADVRSALAERWTAGGSGPLIGIERADSGELIGDLSLWPARPEHRGGEIGWLLHPDHGGRGLATEAAHAALGLAFGALGLHRVVARVDARNLASLRLCARLGMRREAVLRENEWFKGEWTDEVDYALLESEWPPSASASASPPPSSGSRSATESTIRDAR
jgi:RimJ/RimL family protein N-acetyltransferase